MKHVNFFKTGIRMFTMLSFLGAAVYLTGCDKEEDEPAPTQTIWEILGANPQLSQLKAVLDTANLEGTLSGSGTFTLFAPDNQAFTNLLATPGFPADIYSINPAIIANVLAYHLSATQYTSAQLTSGLEISTQSAGNEKIVVTVTGGEITLRTGSTNQNIKIKTSNIRATNGIVHIVESVMIPPTVGASLTPILGTNAGTLLLGAPFSILAECIAKADVFAAGAGVPTLTSILAGSTTHTVFAPTNGTFQQGGITAATYTGQQWYGIIANHVVLSAVLPADLTLGATFSTALPGSQLRVISTTAPTNPAAGIGTGIVLDSNGNQQPNAQVAAPNAAVNSNGRIHVIAGVLAPAN